MKKFIHKNFPLLSPVSLTPLINNDSRISPPGDTDLWKKNWSSKSRVRLPLSHFGIFYPALWSVLPPVAPLPFSLVQHSPPLFPEWISTDVVMYTVCKGANVWLSWSAYCRSFTLQAGSLKMNTALEYSTRVVQEGGRRCKKSTLNDLVHLTPLRIPLMNPPYVSDEIQYLQNCSDIPKTKI